MHNEQQSILDTRVILTADVIDELVAKRIPPDADTANRIKRRLRTLFPIANLASNISGITIGDIDLRSITLVLDGMHAFQEITSAMVKNSIDVSYVNYRAVLREFAGDDVTKAMLNVFGERIGRGEFDHKTASEVLADIDSETGEMEIYTMLIKDVMALVVAKRLSYDPGDMKEVDAIARKIGAIISDTEAQFVSDAIDMIRTHSDEDEEDAIEDRRTRL